MKNIVHLIFIISLSSCTAQKQAGLASINYSAQTRGFLVDLTLNQNEIIYNNNNKVDTLVINKEKWKTLKNITSSLDMEALKKHEVSTDLLAVDRAIPAEITFIIDNEEQRLEFIHGDPPEALKELVREIFSSVSK
jgi:hypothetical protein